MAQVTIRTTDGGEAGSLELSDHVYARAPHHAALYAATQQQMANARQGTHATKNRRLVSGGGKKPWRQKGTGRARQGSTRAPQWRGGGTVHGPVPRSYRQGLPREVRRLAMRSALSDKLAEGRLMILETLAFEAPRTKGFIAMLETLGITGSVLFVTDNLDRNAFLSGRNLQTVDMLPAMGVDVLSVLRHDWLVLTRSAATYLETTLA